MLITTHWVLRNKYQDAKTHEDRLPPGLARAFFNVAYICPECGDLWARLFRETSEPAAITWVAHLKPCPSHGRGTLLDHLVDRKYPPGRIVEEYPPGLIQHEHQRRQ